MEELILIGGGGHCKACIDVIEQQEKYKIAGIVDLPDKIHEKVLGYEVIANDNDLYQLVKEYRNYFITIGQIKTPKLRMRIFNLLKNENVKLPMIVSPYAYVSKHSTIGEGTIVMHNAIINADAKIGCNCIINSNSLIEHEVCIDNHCHISTGAILNGGAVISEGVFIGSNSMIRENIKVGEFSVVGGGCSVFNSIFANSFIYQKKKSKE